MLLDIKKIKEKYDFNKLSCFSEEFRGSTVASGMGLTISSSMMSLSASIR